jgi:hypothetical protein
MTFLALAASFPIVSYSEVTGHRSIDVDPVKRCARIRVQIGAEMALLLLVNP